MEVDCDKEINKKECQGKKDTIGSNVENVKVGINGIQASDMDKMLEDCNKYLNECEEVLQDCAEYLNQCDDREDVEGEEDHSSVHGHNGSPNTLHDGDTGDNGSPNTLHDGDSKVMNDDGMNVAKQDEHIPNTDDSKTKSEGSDTNENDMNNDGGDKVIVKGSPDHSDPTLNNTSQVKDVIEDVLSSEAGNEETKTNVVESTAVDSVSNTGSQEAENSNSNEKGKVIDVIKVDLNQSETESDDSLADGEDVVNLVPLRIQEECDVENDNKTSDTAGTDGEPNIRIQEECDVENDNKTSDTAGTDGEPNVRIQEESDVENDIKTSDTAGTDGEPNVKKEKGESDELGGGETDQTSLQQVSVGDTSLSVDGNKVKVEANESVGVVDNTACDSSHNTGSKDVVVSISDKKDAEQQTQDNLVNENEDKERKKTETELQEKMKVLHEELTTTKLALQSAHKHLAHQQAKSNNIVMSLKLELYKTQAALKKERTKSEKQLTDVISHLTLLEGNLRKGHLKHKQELKARNGTIKQQRQEVMKLREQNEQLLNAIKEICANGGMNGYMREKQSEKKGHNGKLGMVKDKFLMKNRSSLELNNFNLEKFNMKNQRLCSSQEDLKNLHDDAFEQNSPGLDKGGSMFGKSRSASTRGSKYGNKNHRKNLQNFFTESEDPKREMNKSSSDSSQISDTSSGVFSMSDQEISKPTSAGTNGHYDQFEHEEDDDDDDDDDDGRIFSFSSTHINTVIDEEEALGPIMSHTGHMMSMGSMPMLAQAHNDPGQRSYANKDRPHSLSSVDLISIQRQAEKLSKLRTNETIDESSVTPPPSPSYNNNNKPDSGKSEMTPFQTFKTMFKRKGSKNKGNKKRSVSLSQTSNNEYSEALKKHFQKYDMQ